MGGSSKKSGLGAKLGFAFNPIGQIVNPIQKKLANVAGDLLTPPKPPTPGAPPAIPDMPKAQTTDLEGVVSDRMRKLAALRFGFASTITNRASLSGQPATGLKTTLGS